MADYNRLIQSEATLAPHHTPPHTTAQHHTPPHSTTHHRTAPHTTTVEMHQLGLPLLSWPQGREAPSMEGIGS